MQVVARQRGIAGGLLLLLAELAGGADELVQVLGAALVLRVAAVLIHGQQAAFVQQVHQQLGGGQLRGLGAPAFEVGGKGAHGLSGGLGQTGVLFPPHHGAVEVHILLQRKLQQPGHGGVANLAGRGVDDAQQAFGVVGVHQHAQIRERVLHLAPAIEVHATHHHVGDAAAHHLSLHPA